MKLDNLAIIIDEERPNQSQPILTEEWHSYFSLLNELHRLGIYNRLKLYMSSKLAEVNQNIIYEISRLSALINVCIDAKL